MAMRGRLTLPAGSFPLTAGRYVVLGAIREFSVAALEKELPINWSEIATTRTQIKQDRDLVMRYMRAHIEGIARFKQEPELAKKVIKKMLRLDDDSMAQESWELFAKHRIAAPYPNIKGMKTSYEYVAATRPDVYKHKPEEFVDASFVEELDKSGFIKKLYEK